MSMSLTRSKSLFTPGTNSSNEHGYLSPAKLKTNTIVSAVDDDDEDEVFKDEGDQSPSRSRIVTEDPEGVSSPQEGPFSALVPSMRPSLYKQGGN